MLKSIFICVIFAAALTACEQHKQAATEVGAHPKQIIDQAADDLAKAQALAAEQRQAAEAEK